MSYAAPAMWDTIQGVLKTITPINIATFISHVLPPVLFYFIIAALATMPHTRTLRMALWPVLSLFAWRATFSADAPSPLERQSSINLVVSALFATSLQEDSHEY